MELRLLAELLRGGKARQMGLRWLAVRFAGWKVKADEPFGPTWDVVALVGRALCGVRRNGMVALCALGVKLRLV